MFARCPYCFRQTEVFKSQAGKLTVCANCGRDFVVGDVSPTASVRNGQSAAIELIEVTCGCGNQWPVGPELAGKRTLCLACEEYVVVPEIENAISYDESDKAWRRWKQARRNVVQLKKETQRTPERADENDESSETFQCLIHFVENVASLMGTPARQFGDLQLSIPEDGHFEINIGARLKVTQSKELVISTKYQSKFRTICRTKITRVSILKKKATIIGDQKGFWAAFKGCFIPTLEWLFPIGCGWGSWQIWTGRENAAYILVMVPLTTILIAAPLSFLVATVGTILDSLNPAPVVQVRLTDSSGSTLTIATSDPDSLIVAIRRIVSS